MSPDDTQHAVPASSALAWCAAMRSQLGRIWMVTELERLHAWLDTIALAAEDEGSAGLATAAVEVSMYLCSFVGEYGGPNESQCERLLELVDRLGLAAKANAPERAVGVAAQASGPAPVPAPAAPRPAQVAAPLPQPRAEKARFNVLCVSKDMNLLGALDRALQSHHAALIGCSPLDDVVAQVPSFGVQCVIVDADALGVLHELEYNSTRLSRREGARPIFVALMPDHRTSERLRALRAGADHVLVRGRMDELADRLELIIEEHHEEPLRVLVVDDDRSQGVFCQGVLRRFGISTDTCDDPRLAVGLFERQRPDVVLVDLHMPEVDGLELTEALLAQPGSDHVSILFLSGDPEPETRFDALAAGGDDFLAKPIQPRHLIRAILAHGKRAQRRRRRMINGAAG
jgi:DNA-binding response OmpR family regulator